jgi:hypothetical protein
MTARFIGRDGHSFESRSDALIFSRAVHPEDCSRSFFVAA